MMVWRRAIRLSRLATNLLCEQVCAFSSFFQSSLDTPSIFLRSLARRGHLGEGESRKFHDLLKVI